MTPTLPRRKRRIVTTIAAATLLVMAAVVMIPAPAAGQADLSFGNMAVSDTNQTVTGDVSDVTVDSTINYDHDVPDLERRTTKLLVGPNEDNLELIAFRTADPSGEATGSTTLSGSVTDHPALTAEDFDPDVAATANEEITVRAVLLIDRTNGDSIRENVTRTTTITVEDDTELTARIGADTTVDVTTT